MKRVLFMIAITLTLTTLAFAQRGRPDPPFGQRGQGGDRPDRTATLKTALNITDAQVDAIKALMRTRDERAQSIMSDIAAKRQTLNALLDAASPSAADIGNAALAVRAAEKKLAAERDWFIAELKKLLTGEQQQKLDTLMAAQGGRGIPGLGGFGPGPGGPRGQRR